MNPEPRLDRHSPVTRVRGASRTVPQSSGTPQLRGAAQAHHRCGIHPGEVTTMGTAATNVVDLYHLIQQFQQLNWSPVYESIEYSY